MLRKSALYFFNRFEEIAGLWLLASILIVILSQIITRNALNYPLVWAESLSQLLFVYLCMIGISYGFRENIHVNIDFLTSSLGTKASQVCKKISNLLTLTGLFFCIYFGIYLVLDANFEIILLGISEKYLYCALGIFSFLMLYRFLQRPFRNAKFFSTSKRLLKDYALLALILGILLYALCAILESSANASLVIISLWLVVMFIGVPVGISLLTSSIFYFATSDFNIALSASSKLVSSLDSFTILAVPFFVMTGAIMNSGGITDRIFDFAKSLFGRYPGGMGHVNIGASLIFSGMSGSALADAGGLGKLEIKAMKDAGYDEKYATGLSAASCIIGPLVPPSIAMIIYGVISNVSISSLFLAGVIPALLVAFALMIMNFIIAKKHNYPLVPASSKNRAFKRSFLALLTPFIIIGGIFSGIFTPTESAIVATVYCLIISAIYGALNLSSVKSALRDTIAMSGIVALMIMGVSFFGDMIAREQIAQKVAEFFLSFGDSKLSVLLMINLLLLFLGMFIDALALQFLVLPMLIPVAVHFNIDLVFFGIMTLLNMMIGILTPPMGMALFVIARTSNVPLKIVTRGTVPFLIPIACVLILITTLPDIVTFLPNLLARF